MVLIEPRKVVVSPSGNAYQGDFVRIELLQPLAVPDRNEPVARAMNNVGMAVYFPDPFVRAQVIPQHEAHRKDREEALHDFHEIIVGGVEDKVTRPVVCRKFGSKPAPDAASIYDQVMFVIGFAEPVVNELHIGHHLPFASLAGTLAKSAVINEDHVIVMPVKIAGIFSPTLYAPGVAVKVKDQAGRGRPMKMQPVDPYAGFDIKEIFAEGNVVGEFEIGF